LAPHVSTRSTCRDERVEPRCPTSSTATQPTMHGLDTSNVSRRDVTSQVKLGFYWTKLVTGSRSTCAGTTDVDTWYCAGAGGTMEHDLGG